MRFSPGIHPLGSLPIIHLEMTQVPPEDPYLLPRTGLELEPEIMRGDAEARHQLSIAVLWWIVVVVTYASLALWATLGSVD